MKTLFHLLNVKHCNKCPCLTHDFQRSVYSCNIMNKDIFSLNEDGVKNWSSYFPCWCPLLSINFKKPKKSLKLKDCIDFFQAD